MGACGSKQKVKDGSVDNEKQQNNANGSGKIRQEAGSSTADRNWLPDTGRRTDAKVKDIYELCEAIAEGCNSEVRLGTHKESKQPYAIKIMHLSGPGQGEDANTTRKGEVGKEISILMGLQHENIVPTKEYFVEHDHVYVVTEYLSGGELLEAVQKHSSYCEVDARLCFSQILKGIEYLHSNGVTHRDIKSANILMVKGQDIRQIKIIDFDWAKDPKSQWQPTVVHPSIKHRKFWQTGWGPVTRLP